ncbi:hypothetical protein A1Q1_05836 [Trichosporon asahii var. asahii CBS 2479]|uniref:Uncharacterized protein n=1 Tax=Trichosporon asahii var. asahii (strain ATCC 90039 / CBS 2479 / JCM 2466 / KCTC 7840 / NBRC 103889/ NCYC 2677 / UAMH 7654) TaxID=1186058 RepID=J6ESH5_TRIAS|nr:hypothetical protein A1Q1_05836 [Trichosporon asahii var. asahii CBS 2479]EJT45687.1 hypothetical protein A1Q1_05836 [Trichosporon asahii var. asahii CBS 2479]
MHMHIRPSAMSECGGDPQRAPVDDDDEAQGAHSDQGAQGGMARGRNRHHDMPLPDQSLRRAWPCGFVGSSIMDARSSDKRLVTSLTSLLNPRRRRHHQKRPSSSTAAVYSPSDSSSSIQQTPSLRPSSNEAPARDVCNSTSPEASAIYGPPPSDSVLSTSFPGTSTVVPVLNRPAAGYLTSAIQAGPNLQESRRPRTRTVPRDAGALAGLAAVRCTTPAFPVAERLLVMNWPTNWVDAQGLPLYQLNGTVPFTGPHSSTHNLAIPPDQAEDAFPAQYAYSPESDTQPLPATRRGSHGVRDDDDGHRWQTRPAPQIPRGPSGDANHFWQLHGPRRYTYGCTLSVVAEEKGAEDDSGLDLSEQSSTESSSSGTSTETSTSEATTFNHLSAKTSGDSPAPQDHSPKQLDPTVHLSSERRLSIDMFSDDDTFYDAPSQLGSPLPVDWSSDDEGYESAEAGSDDSVFDAEICEAIHCRRESMFSDDDERFSLFSNSRRPSLATDTSSRRPSFATAHEFSFDSRRPSFATTISDEAIEDDDDDDGVSPVSPTTGDMLINIWKSKRSSMLFIDPSAPLPLPSPALLDTPVSPRVPPSPGAASFMSAARPESVLLPDDAEPECCVSESPQQIALSLDSDLAEDEEDPDNTLATLKDFEQEPASIARVTARVYLSGRVAPAQLVYYELMLAASETAQYSRLSRGLPPPGTKRRGPPKAIEVSNGRNSRFFSSHAVF